MTSQPRLDDAIDMPMPCCNTSNRTWRDYDAGEKERGRDMGH